MNELRRASISLCVLLAISCGGGEDEAAEPTDTEPGAGGERAAATDDESEPQVAAILMGGMSQEPRPPRPEPPPVVLPAAREMAPATPTSGVFAVAEAAYERLLAHPLMSEQPALDMGSAVADLTARIEAAVTIVQEVDAACESAAGARSEASTRRADARDALAERMSSVELPIPSDLMRQLASLEPDVQEEVRAMVREQVSQVMLQRAIPLFCLAADLYGEASSAADDGPAAERAARQRAAYGETFLAHCARASAE